MNDKGEDRDAARIEDRRDNRATDARLKRHDLGFLQVAELPTPDALKSYYAERYYQTEQGNYRASYPPEELAYFAALIARKAALVAATRGTDRPGSMLDVGCGEGFALDWFAKAGWEVEGIDHSIAGVEAMNPQVCGRVEAGDLFRLVEQRIEHGNGYDLVWLNNVLEHVIDPVGLLTSLRRLVTPGGVLVVTVPNDGSGYQEALLESGKITERFWIAIPDHLAYFTHDSLRRVAEATGWICREIVADFPIDMFLLHDGSNYVRDRARGPAAHAARVQLELLLAEQPHALVNDYYAAMARVGLGRDLTAFLTPAESGHDERR